MTEKIIINSGSVGLVADRSLRKEIEKVKNQRDQQARAISKPQIPEKDTSVGKTEACTEESENNT